MEPTRSVLYRSAASLAVDCGEFDAASTLIRTGLAGNPPREIAEELEELRGQIPAARPRNIQRKAPPKAKQPIPRPRYDGQGSGVIGKVSGTATVVAPVKLAVPPSKVAGTADQRLKQARRTSILLKHVSDPTRLQVIMILAAGEQHVGALCDQLSQSQPAASHHLALLRNGRIIAPRRQAKHNFYSLTKEGESLAKLVKKLID